MNVRSFTVLCFAVACDPVEEVEVRVEPLDVGVWEIAWDAGAMHEVGSRRCEGGHCACADGHIASDSSSALWVVGSGADAGEGEPSVESPVVYDANEVVTTGIIAPPLEAEQVYAIEVTRYQPCSPAREKCTRIDARGCTLFEL